MIKLRFIVSIAAVVALSVKLCFSACARAEYEVNGECCPMCAPGNHVYWDCSIDTSTTCVPCPASTYSDEPSSSSKCFSCSVCEQGKGLRVKRTCTRSADTVCEPLDGFYCIERNKESCRFTVRHSECSPGQYIIQAGTSSIDTVCADCTGDTYSDGSFSSCLPHTKCEDMGLTETNQGIYSSDTECGNPHTAVAIIALSIAVTLILSVFAVILILKKKQSQNSVCFPKNAYVCKKLVETRPVQELSLEES
ncbi:tumor necrosis factor receptor superfamily member 14-like [Sinocyclocheilus anshuiensis]|uniref:tumor necrosis factor receptor superfamily member 14-like n=1 Tax=Sinocyclocheilus anshuiensis TaxID=1608454 RepID=UPI0007B90B49|nr:PREDICTED: tumor necrosis factor receptor superfamily member 14-like [Sinocyclocheilus anshuiensis]